MKHIAERETPTPKLSNQSKGIERASYGVYFLGQGLVFSVISQLLLYYYTDYALLPPLAISIILSANKIWDAINDTFFGLIVDKAKFKSGNKFLPWIRISTIFIPILTISIFAINKEWSQSFRIVWATLSYLLWAMAYTICDAPIYALSTTMTSNVKERTSIMTLASIGGVVAVGLVTIVIVPYSEKHGFFSASILIAIISFLAMGPICLFGKERYHPSTVDREKTASLKDTWNYLVHNKYLLYFYSYRLLSGSIAVQMLTYVAKYCMGDIKYMSIATLCAIPIIVILYLFSPLIFKRFNKITIFRACTILIIIVHITTFFVGYKNIPLLLCFQVIALALVIFPNIMTGVIPSDCVEYGTYQTGARKEGITFALQTFTSQLTAALAGVITGIVLKGIGYDASLSVMPQTVVDGIWRWNFLIPIAGQLLALGFLFAYKLRDRDVQIMSDANDGKISREEAQQLLSRTY